MKTKVIHCLHKSVLGYKWRETDKWYKEFGQYKPLCWAQGISQTTDDIDKITCKRCLKIISAETKKRGVK